MNDRAFTRFIRRWSPARRAIARLLNLRAVEEILEREQPDIIESSDPYQIGWKAIAVGRALRDSGGRILSFAFSRSVSAQRAQSSGKDRDRIGDGFRAAIRAQALQPDSRPPWFRRTSSGRVLREWGVHNVRVVKLGVNIEIFRPRDRARSRHAHLVRRCPRSDTAPVCRTTGEREKHATLFKAFRDSGTSDGRDDFHLLVIGDGPERTQLGNCNANRRCFVDSLLRRSRELARYYRAADLFVHPGVQETFGLVALESQACGTPVVGIRGSYMDNVIFHEQESWALENTPKRWRTRSKTPATEVVGSGQERGRVRGVYTAGRGCLTNSFAFIARFAQTTADPKW